MISGEIEVNLFAFFSLNIKIEFLRQNKALIAAVIWIMIMFASPGDIP